MPAHILRTATARRKDDMSIRLRGVLAGVLLFVLGATYVLSAQLEHLPYMLKFNSGQNVQPVFEGWSRNPDGSFTMHFGYLNRNYVEEVSISLGPENNIQPGGPDRGQPTYFYTRRNHKAFKVPVPKDWGKKELIWTLTAHGSSDTATGWLQPEWEIGDAGGRDLSEEAIKNQPPTLEVAAVQPITLPTTLTLTAAVTDDGLPKPRPPGARPKAPIGQETPPILQPGPGNAQSPGNLPQLRTNARGQQMGNTPPPGLSVTYIVWRGPAGVTLDPRFAVPKDGKAVTVATFTKPGEYVLRARATDTALSTTEDVKATVNASRATQP
jgi:hypothetical protein